MKKASRIILQVALIHVFLYAAIGIELIIPVPLPTTIIGLFLLFFSLLFGWIKLEWVEEGGRWLLAELLLFFIPSAVGIIDYEEVFGLQGLGAIVVILLSTAVVLATMGLIVERFGVSES
ncbi:holin-like protein [Pelagirhabdus alkalitolerans]|uniref:Holin-like protein n=1 Tax=Pelagirhabdus alkalitolerans TaxID=1612202 RepID=A0A1G6KZP6_9BACI|nr:CidA/LrgA family protein [Pelagirhabdus alkalitolerans]SDC35935.1 holin-like protein [Pelagirhabdus alkalitolerans]